MLLSKSKRLRQVAGFVETTSLLSLRLALKNPSGFRWFPGRVYRTYVQLAGDDRWPARSVFELFPEAAGTRIVVEYRPESGPGQRLATAAYLAYIAKATNPETVFEIGTYRGRSTLNLALNTGPESQILTLDLPDEAREDRAAELSPEDRRLVLERRVGEYFRDTEVAAKITQLRGDSRTFDFSPWQDAVDLVFVDGAHDYDTAVSDTRAALQMLRPGGVVVWDNFGQYGDEHGVTRAALDNSPGPVVQVEDSELAIFRTP